MSYPSASEREWQPKQSTSIFEFGINYGEDLLGSEEGPEFFLALECYREGQEPITKNDQKLIAIQNFFSFGFKIYQYAHLQVFSLNTMVDKYLKFIPVVNKINNNEKS